MKQGNLSRRDLIKAGAVGLAASVLPAWPRSTMAQVSSPEPHFFIQLFGDGGFDVSNYLFDARPLDMTAKGKIQNYIGKDPSVWTGQNGTACLATELTKPLEAFRDYFSIVNGVVMSAGLVGHDQNTNFLFAGNPFGGESFIPHLNVGKRAPGQGQPPGAPIDAISGDRSYSEFPNYSNVLHLSVDSFNKMRKQLTDMMPLNTVSPLNQFVRSRMSAIGLGSGNLAQGASRLFGAHELSVGLSQRLVNTAELIKDPSDDLLNQINVALAAFKAGLTQSMIIRLNGDFDTHDQESCAGQPVEFAQLVEKISKVIKTLRDTPFDTKRSFLDVTTFMFSTEFGRTMRSSSTTPVDKTGTDHNPLTNSMILGGKGIKGGQLLGASDFQTSDEILSGAHLGFDTDSIMIMGRPFDFATQKPRVDKPATFKSSDYITANNVINTVYSIFGMDSSMFRLVERAGARASILSGIVS